MTQLPFVLDLDKLTQEQFDRAMQNPGACRYSAPCILGAMMPDDLIATIVDSGKDKHPIVWLETNGLVAFPSLEKEACAMEVQHVFDSLPLPNNRGKDLSHTDKWRRTKANARLRELLPHLDHGKYL